MTTPRPTARPTPAPAEALAELADHGVDVPPNLDAGELARQALLHRLERGEPVVVEGAYDPMPEGFGFVRSPARDYAACACDAFVSVAQARALNLKPGQWLRGPLRAPRGTERHLALAHVDAANDAPPALLAARLAFAARTPLVAHAPLRLPDAPPWRRLAQLAPWRRGFRVHVAADDAAPRARWLAELAQALAAANPGLRVVLCLLDQAPDDLAAAKAIAAGAAETIGTTFDATAERHVAVAELALARCQREAEAGRDVALLFDALTALAVAQQRSQPSSGRWAAPGLDAQATAPAKRLFAAARAFAEGGSLAVVATTLAGDGVRAAIAAEFAGRGNSAVALAADGDGGGAILADGTSTRPEDDDRTAAARAAARQA